MSARSVLLQSEVEVLSGFAWKSSKFKKQKCGLPIIRIQNVGSSRESNFVYWDDEFDERFLIRKGELLLTLSGSFRLAEWQGDIALLNQRILKLTPSSNLDSHFFLHFMQTQLDRIERMGKYALVNNVAVADIKSLQIPLPPLPEQKRIATILDAADALRTKRRESLAQLDVLLQSTFLTLFGDPVENPMGWEFGVIGDLLRSTNYGTSKKADPEKGTFPVLRMNNITYTGEWDFSSLKYINLDEKDLSRYLVYKGHILFNRTNSRELVGKTAVFRAGEPMAFAGYLVRGIVNNAANPEYIGAFMNTLKIKKFLRNKCKSIVGMANINAKEFQAIPIPIPPLDLQNQFANIVETIKKQKTRQRAHLAELDKLFASLQHRAFQGEL